VSYKREEIMDIEQQIVDAIEQFIKQHPSDTGMKDQTFNTLIVEMSKMTFNLISSGSNMVMDKSKANLAYRKYMGSKTKLGFPFPKPDALLSIPYQGINWETFVYFDDKMKALKLRLSIVQVIRGEVSL
jgi:hypothetical protein